MYSVILPPPVPRDLLRPIFEHLESDKASLCAISLVSPIFRNEAQCILFRNVTTLKTYTAHIKFLSAVAASPTRLGPFVRSYRQCWDYDTPPVRQFMKILRNIVGHGLKALSSLKELYIAMFTTLSDSQRAYIQILSACTFKLERFHWEVHQKTSDELVESFLSRQRTLRHLGLMYTASLTHPSHIIPPTTCPQLVSVTAGWDMIKALLPGRKISRLILKGWETDVTDAEIQLVAAELKCVKGFSISFPILRETKSLYHGILQYFSSLQVLEIYCIDYHDDEGLYFRLQVDELVGMLSELPALQTLILSVLLKERTRQEDIEIARRTFAKFGNHLKRIYIETGGDLYMRYMHSPETEQKTGKEEVRKLWLMTV